MLVTLVWENTEDFKTKHFWIEVKSHMDAAGCKDFDELGSFALSLLAILTTQMTLRNRVKDSFMENIICIWAFMQRHEICCHQFGPT